MSKERLEQAVRQAVRAFWVNDVNKPIWFTAEQNERLVQRVVSAVAAQVE